MTPKLATICRLNQARSIISSATIRNLFDELEIYSAGTHANSGKMIPKITERLCRKWNLTNFDHYSKSVVEIRDLLNRAEILAADGQVATELIDIFASSNISMLSDFVDDERLIPVDPLGFTEERYELELSKVATSSIRWVEKILEKKLPNLDSLIYLNRDFKGATLNLDSLDFTLDYIYIDGDFKIPNYHYWSENGFDVLEFNPRDLTNFTDLPNQRSKPLILVSKFEVDSPGAIFLSNQWREFLSRLQIQNKIRVITGLSSAQKTIQSEQVLSTAHSALSRIIQL